MRLKIFMENMSTCLLCGVFASAGVLLFFSGLATGLAENEPMLILTTFIMTIFLFLFSFLIGWGVLKEILTANIEEKGYSVEASVSEVIFKPNEWVNGVNPSYFKAVYVNSKGTVKTFKSENFGVDIREDIHVGDKIKVYVFNDNCRLYKIDMMQVQDMIVYRDMDLPGEYTGREGTNELNVDYNYILQQNIQGNDFSAYDKIKNAKQNHYE